MSLIPDSGKKARGFAKMLLLLALLIEIILWPVYKIRLLIARIHLAYAHYQLTKAKEARLKAVRQMKEDYWNAKENHHGP